MAGYQDRRTALKGAALVGAAVLGARGSRADTGVPGGGKGFAAALAKVERRREFRTVPMVLTAPEEWDAVALRMVLAHGGRHRQVWSSKGLEGWLSPIRNAVNAQVLSFGHEDFVAVSAVHGPAQVALFDQAMWDKYRLAALTKGAMARNTLAVAGHAEGADVQDPKGIYGPAGDTIPALQSRGVVFMACHNAIWGMAGALIGKGVNPDGLAQGALAAELTNHLVKGVILTPGITGTIPELQAVGYHYIG